MGGVYGWCVWVVCTCIPTHINKPLFGIWAVLNLLFSPSTNPPSPLAPPPPQTTATHTPAHHHKRLDGGRGANKMEGPLPGPLQWIIGAVEPFEESCLNLFRDRLMVDLEARRQGDDALRETPRSFPTPQTCPVLRHLSPARNMAFAGIERISILARHLQQRQEAKRVTDALRSAMYVFLGVERGVVGDV